jgi:hypothetical protein
LDVVIEGPRAEESEVSALDASVVEAEFLDTRFPTMMVGVIPLDAGIKMSIPIE